MKRLAWFIVLAPIALLVFAVLGVGLWLLVAINFSDVPST
jgi:hypothetical protein